MENVKASLWRTPMKSEKWVCALVPPFYRHQHSNRSIVDLFLWAFVMRANNFMLYQAKCEVIARKMSEIIKEFIVVFIIIDFACNHHTKGEKFGSKTLFWELSRGDISGNLAGSLYTARRKCSWVYRNEGCLLSRTGYFN